MSNPKVVVYTSYDCSDCNQVLSMLSECDVDYKEKNINKHIEYFKELQRQRIYGTPATFINDEKILGYQKRRLQQTLGVEYEDRSLASNTMITSRNIK